MTTSAAPTATVEIPFDLLCTLATLAAHAKNPGDYEAHKVRDALVELHGELDRIEVETVGAWGMDLDRHTARANEMFWELMQRAGHA